MSSGTGPLGNTPCLAGPSHPQRNETTVRRPQEVASRPRTPPRGGRKPQRRQEPHASPSQAAPSATSGNTPCPAVPRRLATPRAPVRRRSAAKHAGNTMHLCDAHRRESASRTPCTSQAHRAVPRCRADRCVAQAAPRSQEASNSQPQMHADGPESGMSVHGKIRPARRHGPRRCGRPSPIRVNLRASVAKTSCLLRRAPHPSAGASGRSASKHPLPSGAAPLGNTPRTSGPVPPTAKRDGRETSPGNRQPSPRTPPRGGRKPQRRQEPHASPSQAAPSATTGNTPCTSGAVPSTAKRDDRETPPGSRHPRPASDAGAAGSCLPRLAKAHTGTKPPWSWTSE
jgi:hypothetical protein